jgi:enoyl-CoA hydratase/carnithine racemase
VGSEFALACDLRFASRERAILGQPEVAVGLLPGGGATERLPRLVERARALGIPIGGDDFDALTAERCGWVSRALPDEQLDAFVEGLTLRIAPFERRALSEIKALANRVGLPEVSELLLSQRAFVGSMAWEESQSRAASLLQHGLQKRGDFEIRLGHRLGTA